jgi:uncharacterized C2H2 Zn-finger protein
MSLILFHNCPYCDETYVKKQPLSVHVNSIHKHWVDGKLVLDPSTFTKEQE